MIVDLTLQALFPAADAIPTLHQQAPLHQRRWLVDGQIRDWDGPFQQVSAAVWEPDGRGGLQPVALGSYPLLGAEQALEALDAAERAFDHGRGHWPTLRVEERIACMEDFTHRMVAQREAVVRLLMWEIGKPLSAAAKEFDRTVAYIRDTIDALKDLDRASSRFQVEDGIMAQVRRAPLGVVLCMGPFNYPLNETFTTLIPALLMGNTVVFKPPKLGVLLHEPLLEAFRDAFPPGVVNTVYGSGATTIGPVMASGKVDCLAFIGSARVADHLKQQHPRLHRLRSVLGLGAKNPAIILPDADLDLTVAECTTGALSFNGQRCTALKIIFVHSSIAEAFVERLALAVDNLKLGMPWDPGVAITPLPEAGKPDWMATLVQDAVDKGARVVNAGGGRQAGGLYAPTVVCPVAPGMKLWTEEQFGPIVAVAPFDDLEQPVRYMVESDYGQQVSIFGRDAESIARLIDPLVNQVCRVNLNSQCQRGPDVFPFTGRKDSAEGTLSVSDALRVFSIRTLVAAKNHGANKAIITEILRSRRSAFLSTDFIL